MRKDIITYLIIPVSLILALALGCHFLQQKYGLRYQVSSSMPKGYYFIRYSNQQIQRNDLVVFKAPALYENFLLARHYIPNRGELLKKVVAVPGDIACLKNGILWVNHQQVAYQNNIILNDPTIPKEAFCGTLSKDHFLVLGPYHPRSYDSRYFGAIPRQNIIGKAYYL